MFSRPSILVAALALSAPAFATGGSLDVCEDGIQTYDMYNYNTGSKARVIWAPNLGGCGGKTLLSIPDATLWHYADMEADGDGIVGGMYETEATIVQSNCTSGDFKVGKVWDVSFDLIPAATNTEPKSPNSEADDWLLSLVDNGRMKRGSHVIKFTNMPDTLQYGNQIGNGANPIDSDSEFGGAFWFYWTQWTGGCKIRTGHGDFNYDLDASCEPPPDCPVDSSSPLGPASGFNVYTVEDISASSSDIAGKTAAGGDASFYNYGLNSGGGSGTSLFVTGQLTATNVQIYGSGGGEAGSCVTSSFTGTMDCTGSSFDAGSTDNVDDLNDILDFVAAESVGAPSASLNMWWPQLIVDGGTGSGRTIVNVDSCDIQDQIEAKWSWASNIQGWDIKAGSGATLVINVTGSCSSYFFQNGYMGVSGGVDKSDIIWVVQDWTSLDIANVGLKGSLFAPNTAVTFNSAHIDGTLVAFSLSGGGESHSFEFDGDLCPTP